MPAHYQPAELESLGFGEAVLTLKAIFRLYYNYLIDFSSPAMLVVFFSKFIPDAQLGCVLLGNSLLNMVCLAVYYSMFVLTMKIVNYQHSFFYGTVMMLISYLFTFVAIAFMWINADWLIRPMLGEEVLVTIFMKYIKVRTIGIPLIMIKLHLTCYLLVRRYKFSGVYTLLTLVTKIMEFILFMIFVAEFQKSSIAIGNLYNFLAALDVIVLVFLAASLERVPKNTLQGQKLSSPPIRKFAFRSSMVMVEWIVPEAIMWFSVRQGISGIVAHFAVWGVYQVVALFFCAAGVVTQLRLKIWWHRRRANVPLFLGGTFAAVVAAAALWGALLLAARRALANFVTPDLATTGAILTACDTACILLLVQSFSIYFSCVLRALKVRKFETYAKLVCHFGVSCPLAVWLCIVQDMPFGNWYTLIVVDVILLVVQFTIFFRVFFSNWDIYRDVPNGENVPLLNWRGVHAPKSPTALRRTDFS